MKGKRMKYTIFVFLFLCTGLSANDQSDILTQIKIKQEAIYNLGNTIMEQEKTLAEMRKKIDQLTESFKEMIKEKLLQEQDKEMTEQELDALATKELNDFMTDFNDPKKQKTIVNDYHFKELGHAGSILKFYVIKCAHDIQILHEQLIMYEQEQKELFALMNHLN